MDKKISADKLTAFGVKIFTKAGLPAEDAKIVTDVLVQTDLRGVESHGFGNTAARYIEGLKSGTINAKPNIRVISKKPSTAVVDGDKGEGHLVSYRAMTEAINRADKEGSGFVTVRNSGHHGASQIYALMALPRDMIGISLTCGGPGMVPPGAKVTGAGINVISIAVPTNHEHPFVLDMATTVAAGLHLAVEAKRTGKIPAGWAIDAEGNPVTDPAKYPSKDGGGLLPLGGTPLGGSYKGFGLSVAVEILCSILSGSPSIALRPNYGNRGLHFFGALRIDSYGPVDEFKKNMDAMINMFHGLPRLPGVDRIGMAGEGVESLDF